MEHWERDIPSTGREASQDSRNRSKRVCGREVVQEEEVEGWRGGGDMLASDGELMAEGSTTAGHDLVVKPQWAGDVVDVDDDDDEEKKRRREEKMKPEMSMSMEMFGVGEERERERESGKKGETLRVE